MSKQTPKEAFEILKEFTRRKYDNEDYWNKKRLDAEKVIEQALQRLDTLEKDTKQLLKLMVVNKYEVKEGFVEVLEKVENQLEMN